MQGCFILTLTALINILYNTVDVIMKQLSAAYDTKRQVNYTTRAKSARQIVACKRTFRHCFKRTYACQGQSWSKILTRSLVAKVVILKPPP